MVEQEPKRERLLKFLEERAASTPCNDPPIKTAAEAQILDHINGHFKKRARKLMNRNTCADDLSIDYADDGDLAIELKSCDPSHLIQDCRWANKKGLFVAERKLECLLKAFSIGYKKCIVVYYNVNSPSEIYWISLGKLLDYGEQGDMTDKGGRNDNGVYAALRHWTKVP